MCATLLCGDPLACCGAMDECVADACLPACASGVRCGDAQETCCAGGEVCLGGQCVAPVGPCMEAFDCGAGEFCDPVLGECLPQPEPPGCAKLGGGVDADEEWAWEDGEVVSMPVVADVDDDGSPDIVVTTTKLDPAIPSRGDLVLLDGVTGAEKWRISHAPAENKFGANGVATLAVADVSGDGVPDIIYAGWPDGVNGNTIVSSVHAVDGAGKLLWTGHLADDTVVKARIAHGSATVANLDDDPQAEIAFGALIFDHDGLLVWNQDDNGGQFGTPLYLNGGNAGQPIYTGGLATFADLDGDMKPELVTGREAWKITWTPGSPPNVSLALFWQNKFGTGNDGWPAVADLDGNGTPEVVLTAWPEIRVIDGKSGKLWCGIDPTGALCMNNDAARTQPIGIKGGNLGGPATIADFDGDGRPEAGIAGGVAYAVYDFNRDGEQVVKPANDPPPAAGAMYARWSSTTQDNSSAATGSMAFDLTGDGRPEAIYNDECAVRVFDGETGEVVYQRLNSSSTVHEYPVVADVDGDDTAEIVVVGNLGINTGNQACLQKFPDFVPRKGVFVLGPGGAPRPAARRLWTQHTYHVTNAGPSGHVPEVETDHWTAPGVNSFRQGTAALGTLNAPDLTVSLAADLKGCPAELLLVATVSNKGDVAVPAGQTVTFYEGLDDKGAVLGMAATSESIAPGGSTVVTQIAATPGAKTDYHATIDPLVECYLGNNTSTLPGASCPP
jgi:hypothetical protein